MAIAELQDSVDHTEALASGPLAVVHGAVVDELPQDLFVPPEALRVFLESFEGPLDLLLYLIRRQNLEVIEISVSTVTEQYMAYVNLMEAHQFELAAEYLVMAATLAEIKSRMLLPRERSSDEDEADPRADLARRLQEYAIFRQAAEALDEVPRVGRDTLLVGISAENVPVKKTFAQLDAMDLQQAFKAVLKRAALFEGHHITPEALSTRERMSGILQQVQGQSGYLGFADLFKVEEGRKGVVVTFVALLELVKEGLIELIQNSDRGPIYIGQRTGSSTEEEALEYETD